jgi:prepilin-type N-terminal cleavage/methylation domain-containing protein
MRSGKQTQSGFTLIELIFLMAIIAILAAVATPVASNLIRSQKEQELRRAPRELRKTIDTHNVARDSQLVGPLDRKVEDE